MNKFLFLLPLVLLTSNQIFAQAPLKKFEVQLTETNNSIVEISNESIQKLKDLGFNLSPHYDYLSRNYSEHFDFNKDGFKDIVWIMPKNPSIGSPVMLFLWNQEKRKYIEQTSYFILGHGDHMMYYDTVDDFDRDGDLDIFLPTENYHGEMGKQPNYYLPAGNFVPGNLLFNDDNKLSRVYIDTTSVDYGNGRDYLPFWQAALINYDEDDKKDLIVSSVNRRPDGQGYLATKYTVSAGKQISREFIFPWESNQMYQGQSHSLKFKNYGDNIYAFMQSREDVNPIEEQPTKGYSYTYPEIRIYSKSKGQGLPPAEIRRFELKRNTGLINQNSIMYHDTFYVEDLDKDGKEEIIIGMFTVPMNDKHSSVHVFDNQGNEVSDKWFQNLEFIETTRAAGNGFDMVDLNGDGYMDILFRDRFNSTDSNIPFFLNTGSKFEKHVIETSGPPGFNLAVDTNKDGLIEILKVRNQEPDPNKVVSHYTLSYKTITDHDNDGVLTINDPCPAVYGLDKGCPDTKAPTLVLKNSHTLVLPASGTSTLEAATLNNGSTDNVGITQITLSKSTFTCADLGANKVIFTAKDASGNASSAEVTVTVVDEIKPMTKVKSSYVIKLDVEGKATLKWEDIDEGSTDNCSITNRKLSKTEFSRTDGGDNKVTYTITDASGNTSSIETTVRVDIVLSAPERKNQSNVVKAYPNPVNDYLYLEFAEGISTIRGSSLVDASGRVLGEIRLEEGSDGALGFSTRELKPGMYFLRLSTRDTLHLIKFAVIH